MKVTGVGKYTRRLRNMRNIAKQVTAALYDAGQEIELDAEISISSGASQFGRHVPSRPGEPPNMDTGDLIRSIETTVEAQNPPTVHVTAGGPVAPYAAYLEYGTSKMAERPFMRTAAEKNRAKVAKKVAAAVKIAIRKA
ncbi:hypothetical protein C5748_22025 [Phyllobacterium phragmitis]|uniref:HK97 gp10 family phage protein n=1 Tax=Phyllobacterium phragmitis TaxID=2670329 RepID=A0A2S9ILK5_9HYPH|nr:hypothetical protein C5748_22025 [Phyllobacterium phragmitis]